MSRLHVERNGLTRQSLDEDLHSTTQPQHQMQCAFLLDVVRFPSATRARPSLDVVVRQCPAILELLACENQTLLIRRNAFHVVNGVGRLSLAAKRR